MDDTQLHSQEFTDHLNSVDDDIKWMREGEVVMEELLDGNAMAGEEEISVRVERALVLLDTWMVVEFDGYISTKVFRKDTHTEKYITFSSNHPLERKRGSYEH